jgi:putative nucleotidyltransferase with HDIG domain
MMEPITHEAVLASCDKLPAFPRVVTQILATLDDPDAGLNTLAAYIEHDPVITARVISLSNRASHSRRQDEHINDVFTAISLVGLTQVRQTVLMTSLVGFLEGVASARYFWEHSAVVGVASIELASHAPGAVHRDMALIAGLLHDVGQLWLVRFYPTEFAQARAESQASGRAIDVCEREVFGVDHAQIGAWLVQNWGFSAEVVEAIAKHHAPIDDPCPPLVAVVHIAEVLSHALDVTANKDNHVTFLSTPACQTLGLEWDDSAQTLFGRIEARSRHAISFLR